MKSLDYSLYLEVAGRYVQIAVFTAFVIGCFRLWRITCRISLGFELIGRIVTIVLFSALVLMAFGPQRVVLFRIIVYLSLSIWLFYTTWYFTHYPIPAEYLKSDRNPEPPGAPVFLPKQALLRYLVGESPALKQPWWHSHAFRNVGLGCVGLLLLAYGFTQTINGYTFGYQLAAVVQERSSKATDKAVKAAAKAAADTTRKAIAQATKPLYAGQQWLAQKFDTGRKESEQRAKTVRDALNRASRTKASPALIIIAPKSKDIPAGSFSMPSVQTPPAAPTPRRGRKTSYYDMGREYSDEELAWYF